MRLMEKRVGPAASVSLPRDCRSRGPKASRSGHLGHTGRNRYPSPISSEHLVGDLHHTSVGWDPQSHPVANPHGSFPTRVGCRTMTTPTWHPMHRRYHAFIGVDGMPLPHLHTNGLWQKAYKLYRHCSLLPGAVVREGVRNAPQSIDHAAHTSKVSTWWPSPIMNSSCYRRSKKR